MSVRQRLLRYQTPLIALLALAMVWVWWRPGLGYTDDDARVILEARQMATGVWPNHEGAEEGTPVRSHIGMVATLVPVCGSLFLMHLAVWACYLALLAVVVRWRGLLAGVCVAVSPWLLYWSADIMTETPFALFSVWALWKADERRWAWALLLAAVACTFRSIGVTVVGAVALLMIWEHRKSPLVRWLAPMTAVVAYVWMSRTHGSIPFHTRGPYDERPMTWGDYPDRILSNLWTYISEAGPYALLPQDGAAVWSVLGALLLAACLCGVVRGRQKTILTYLAVTSIPLLLWPESLSGSRYIAPLLPVLLVGLTKLAQDTHWRKRLGIAAVALFLLTSTAVNGARVFRGPRVPMGFGGFFRLAEEAGKGGKLPADSVVICRKPSAWQVLSGTKATGFPFAEPDSILRWMRRVAATHVVVDQMEYGQTETFLLPVVWDNRREEFREGFAVAGWARTEEEPNTVLLRVDPSIYENLPERSVGN